MIEQAVLQLAAVIVGGLLSITGGFFSTLILDRQREKAQARNLALSFKGEISALVAFIEARGYRNRVRQVIAQIEQTQQPFYMPYRIHYQYDRVYNDNVDKLGVLRGSLPELIPRFYTQMVSVLEDMAWLGEGPYEQINVEVLLRVYRDMLGFIERTVELGEEIILEINREYASPSVAR